MSIKLNWSSAFFESAFGTSDQLPLSDLPEICFAGRSNVGKSSLINKILGRKSLARVSSTPGKTVTINFYRIGDVRLADLPGYGYAKVSDDEKMRWAQLMEEYFTSGRDIRLVLQLIDMRHKASEDDIAMLELLDSVEMPYIIVLTKCDKLNKTEFNNRLKLFKEELGYLAEDVPMIPFSALKGTGTEDIRAYITESLE